MQLIMYVLYSVSILHIYGRLLVCWFFLYGLFMFVLHSCVDLHYVCTHTHTHTHTHIYIYIYICICIYTHVCECVKILNGVFSWIKFPGVSYIWSPSPIKLFLHYSMWLCFVSGTVDHLVIYALIVVLWKRAREIQNLLFLDAIFFLNNVT
jgi:hypothetical protein